jgi:ubiquinone/menaquinone biosynthesis C-methylase UbiE
MGAHLCPWWVAYTFDNPLRHLFHSPERMLGAYVEKGMTALDVGCGMGFFSIGLARLVGEEGLVIALDVQKKMLEKVKKRSQKAGVSNIIRLHKSKTNQLGVSTRVDLVLAFWMVHEVPDPKRFFHQVRALLKPHGKVFVAEPRFHVSSKRFQEILDYARKAGLKRDETPQVRFSRAAVLSVGA